MLSVHEEYLQSFTDIKMGIAHAILDLMNMGIVNKGPFATYGKLLIRTIIYAYISQFVFHVAELELYFNIKRSDITIMEDAVALGFMKKIINKKTGAITYYTNDFRDYRKSMGIIYDKLAKLISDNQTSNEELQSNQFPIRLEFRLNNINCNWLHINNLKGSYKQIFNRFCPFLEIKYNQLFADNISINPNNNKYLKKLVEGAKTNSAQRYTGDELKKSNKILPDSLKPFQIENKTEKCNALIDSILANNKTLKITKKVIDLEEKVTNCDVIHTK